MQSYGLVKSTFADVSYTDMEPVDNDFIGVDYYIAEDVDFEISRLKDAINKSMKQTDELIAMVDGLLS